MTAAASAFLAGRGFSTPTLLASGHPHGVRMRYRAGCRCVACRRANTDYEKARDRERKAGNWNGVISAEVAQRHILALRDQGVGRRQVADASGVAESIVAGIGSGSRKQARALTVKAILAVTSDAVADHALIDAGPSWALLNELLATGYTKARLARELGYASRGLQLNRHLVTARNALEVARLYKRLRRIPAAATLMLVSELREEGYHLKALEKLLSAHAGRLGVAPPDLKVYGVGYISAATADLVARVHAEVLAEGD